MKFEMGETYKTRNGNEVQLVHTFDYKGEERLVWLGIDKVGPWVHQTHGDGRWIREGETACDVLPPKQSGTVWVNVYPGRSSPAHLSRDIADKVALESRIACIEVQWEEGQGL